MIGDVFPQRNLPSRAETWGRAVESEIRLIEKGVVQQESRVDNWARFTGGQLSVQGAQLNEVAERAALSQTLADMSATGSATAEPFPRANRTVTFPATRIARKAFVTVSGNTTSSSTIGERAYVYILHGGEVIGGAWAQPFSPTSTPVEWQNDAPITVFGTLNTVANTSTSLTVRLVRAADMYSPGSSTLTFKDITVTMAFSGGV